jgi:hypothetical protein
MDEVRPDLATAVKHNSCTVCGADTRGSLRNHTRTAFHLRWVRAGARFGRPPLTDIEVDRLRARAVAGLAAARTPEAAVECIEALLYVEFGASLAAALKRGDRDSHPTFSEFREAFDASAFGPVAVAALELVRSRYHRSP